jgi:hypothetical protein
MLLGLKMNGDHGTDILEYFLLTDFLGLTYPQKIF